MKSFKNYILSSLQKNIKSIKGNEENLTILNKGQFANAIVYRYKDEDHDYTIKDFYHCPFIIRVTFGRIMARIEHNVIKRLSSLNGIASEVHLITPYTVAFSYVDGKPLKALKKEGIKLEKEFFLKLEKLVDDMHSRGIVHLDLRNFGNIICSKDGNPYIIDFQSSISSKKLPDRIKKILEDSDMSGVYKAWNKLGAVPLPREKKLFLEEFNQLRKVWVFRGYPITRLKKKLKKYFAQSNLLGTINK